MIRKWPKTIISAYNRTRREFFIFVLNTKSLSISAHSSLFRIEIMFHHRTKTRTVSHLPRTVPTKIKKNKTTTVLTAEEQILEEGMKRASRSFRRSSSSTGTKVQLPCGPRCVLLTARCSDEDSEELYLRNGSPMNNCVDTSTFLNTNILFADQKQYGDLCTCQLEGRQRRGVDIEDEIPVSLASHVEPEPNPLIKISRESLDEKMSRFFSSLDHSTSSVVDPW